MKDRNFKVYAHINKFNMKVYIGTTCQNVLRRWRHDGSGYKNNKHFWNAINKYGWNNFEHKILLDNLTQSLAAYMEKFLISELKTDNLNYGYNLSSGGLKSSVGSKRSIEWRRKISEMQKGLKNQRARKIRCILTGEIFNTVMQAGLSIGKTRSAIYHSMLRNHPTGGYHWLYADEFITCNDYLERELAQAS